VYENWSVQEQHRRKIETADFEFLSWIAGYILYYYKTNE